jgi:urease accessory protein
MKFLPPAIALTLLAGPAFAHLPPGEYGSFAAGLSHPLFGPDHVLAMVSVGLWAGMLGGRARVSVPAAFLSLMLLGFLMALGGLALPFVEPMILASIVVLGLLVATAARLDARAEAALVGVFALFHGHAHGGELGSAGALSFGLGFVLATAALHAAGIGLGLGLESAGRRIGRAGPLLTRGLGAVTAIAGLGLAFG